MGFAHASEEDQYARGYAAPPAGVVASSSSGAAAAHSGPPPPGPPPPRQPQQQFAGDEPLAVHRCISQSVSQSCSSSLPMASTQLRAQLPAWRVSLWVYLSQWAARLSGRHSSAQHHPWSAGSSGQTNRIVDWRRRLSGAVQGLGFRVRVALCRVAERRSAGDASDVDGPCGGDRGRGHARRRAGHDAVCLWEPVPQLVRRVRQHRRRPPRKGRPSTGTDRHWHGRMGPCSRGIGTSP
jgi:hypothetical protein